MTRLAALGLQVLIIVCDAGIGRVAVVTPLMGDMELRPPQGNMRLIIVTTIKSGEAGTIGNFKIYF